MGRVSQVLKEDLIVGIVRSGGGRLGMEGLGGWAGFLDTLSDGVHDGG